MKGKQRRSRNIPGNYDRAKDRKANEEIEKLYNICSNKKG
jgi:hypothetical protein